MIFLSYALREPSWAERIEAHLRRRGRPLWRDVSSDGHHGTAVVSACGNGGSARTPDQRKPKL